MTIDPLTRACELASAQAPDKRIAGCLVIDCGLDPNTATRFVAENRERIDCHRDKGACELLLQAKAIAMGHVEKPTGAQVQALSILGNAYLGWGVRLEDVVRQVKKDVGLLAPNGRNVQLVKSA